MLTMLTMVDVDDAEDAVDLDVVADVGSVGLFPSVVVVAATVLVASQHFNESQVASLRNGGVARAVPRSRKQKPIVETFMLEQVLFFFLSLTTVRERVPM